MGAWFLVTGKNNDFFQGNFLKEKGFYYKLYLLPEY
jgi:hypothetical protein